MCLTLEKIRLNALQSFQDNPGTTCVTALTEKALSRLRQECALQGCGDAADLSDRTRIAVGNLAAQEMRRRELGQAVFSR